MKLLIVLALVGLTVARPEDLFQYDQATFDGAITNARLLDGYGDCMLKKGPCTKEGKELTRVIPIAITGTCAKCSENDKKIAAKFLKAFQTVLPEKYEAVVKQYDPTGARRAELDQFISQNAS